MQIYSPKDTARVPDFQVGGLLLLDKPLTWTSFDVVNKLRYRLSKLAGVKRLKVGHAGTLDPLASGLLLVCFGKHTSGIDSLMGMPKTYTGTIQLGATTPSYDAETAPDATYPTAHITPELIAQVRPQFVGKLAQIPPIYSAIKSGGRPAYKDARAGRDIVMTPRNIEITSFELLPNDTTPDAYDFETSCSKGTYIRSLAYDFGKAVGSGGYLSALRRTEIGPYSVENAWQMADIMDWFDNIQQQNG